MKPWEASSTFPVFYDLKGWHKDTFIGLLEVAGSRVLVESNFRATASLTTRLRAINCHL